MKSTTNLPASRAGNRAVAGKRANSTSIAAVEGHLSRLIGEKVRSSRLHVLPSQCNQALETEGT